MENGNLIDLYSVRFWGTVVAACLVMIPLVGGPVRRLAFALISLGFLTYLLRADVAVVLGLLLATYGMLRLIEAGRFRGVWLALGGAAVLALFLMHKLPRPSWSYGPVHWHPVLTAIGYSYVALRLIEVARAVAEGRHRAPSLTALIAYLLPFHMLAAGPIQAYDDFVAQPDTPPAPGPAVALRSIERIAMGMFKKFVIANALEMAFLTSFRATGPYFFLELQINYLWLFLDFSAYSDIAFGIGGLIGVATPENFNRPYIARNMIDYWERWHISLSMFIRRNIFIPLQLGLMRRTDGRHPLLIASVALAASFLLCGLWHNIGWNWLTWGAYHAVGLVVCNIYREFLLRRLGRKGLKQYLANRWIRVLATALTFEYVALSLVLVTYPWSLFDLFGPGR
jgi:D-alanyl-lipoteichoic acid acyltransferase DltB (MBOAT superfamily)